MKNKIRGEKEQFTILEELPSRVGLLMLLETNKPVIYYRPPTKDEWKNILKYFKKVSKMNLFELNNYLSWNDEKK
jgi:hypothetical protein